MKYNEIKKRMRWQKPFVLGLAVLLSGMLLGCADGKLPGKIEDEKFGDEFVENINKEEETPTDIFEDKNEGQLEDETDSGLSGETSDVSGETEQVDGTESTVETESEPKSEVQTQPEPEPEPEPELPDPELEGYPELKYDKSGWGLVYGESGAQSRGNEKAKTLAEYNAYYIGSAETKEIYLTFDCGYENGNTDLILNALAEHGVTATFFVTGHFLEKQPELVKRMVNEGHAVASHSYNHPDITQFTTKEELAKELDPVKEKFYEITGTELSMYFRPPEGKCYAKGMKWSKDMGYATIFWSVAHVDWNTSNQPDPEKAIKTLTNRIHPGAIVLLHNTSSTNGAIINELIGKWEEMGYTIAPLSNLVGY